MGHLLTNFPIHQKILSYLSLYAIIVQRVNKKFRTIHSSAEFFVFILYVGPWIVFGAFFKMRR